MSADVAIRLTRAQVREVLRAAAGTQATDPLAALDTHALATANAAAGAPGSGAEQRLSSSLLRGLALLAAAADGEEHGIVQLARAVGISPSSAHRYAQTLVAAGLLERCPETRRYRLARNTLPARA